MLRSQTTPNENKSGDEMEKGTIARAEKVCNHRRRSWH